MKSIKVISLAGSAALLIFSFTLNKATAKEVKKSNPTIGEIFSNAPNVMKQIDEKGLEFKKQNVQNSSEITLNCESFKTFDHLVGKQILNFAKRPPGKNCLLHLEEDAKA